MTQNLPIGAVSSPHAVRLRRTPISRLRRVRLHSLLTAVGVVAAVAGAIVSVTPGPVTVVAGPSDYEIGGTRLEASSPGVYQGAGGAALVIAHRGGATRAGASAALDGQHMTGSCTLVDGSRTETCQFTLAGRRLTAVDRWTGDGWSRRYDDGRTVDIRVAGGAPVPVPVAVGR